MEVLANRNPEVKPKDDFKDKYPNYRNFSVDPEPPLSLTTILLLRNILPTFPHNL